MKKRILAMILTLAMVLSMVPALGITASAEGTEYSLAQLLTAGQIKPLSRTAVNPDNTGIMCDWPGNGFSMNVSGAGGTMSIGVTTNYEANWAVLVDGEQVWWERLGDTGGTISASIPAGSHTVTVVKESDNKGKETNFCDLTTMTFGGTIEAKPADKALTIEFIGDSYTCGHGTLGSYNPGVNWEGEQHSFTHGYAYYTAQNLNADYMIAARGGIGLFDGVSAEQPDDDPDATIADIYPYTAGFRKSAGLYDFAVQPDIVVIEIGANDTIKTSDANFTIEAWEERLESLTDTVREKNPNAHIVYLSHRSAKYKVMKKVCEERAATDPKLYAFSFAHQGNGSGNAGQYYGHPDALDSKRLADALTAFLVERDLTGATAAEPEYNDYIYYAAGDGNDSNTGAEGSAKLTVAGVLKQAVSDRTYAEGDRIVINVTGTVKMSTSSTQAMANVPVLTESGKKVPILVQTNNYSGTKATLDTAHTTSTSSSRIVFFCNDMTLKNINFQSSKHSTADYWDYQVYAGYNHIVFDNVTFGFNGDCTTPWRVSAGHVLATDAHPVPTVETGSSVTFKNGDYTNLDFATCVLTPKLYTGNLTSLPVLDCRLIIEDGAKMGTVYNRYSTMSYGNITLEVRGGSIQKYIGTQNGTGSEKLTYNGDINLVMTGGNIYGEEFNAVGRYVNITGGVNNTISGGIIEIRPVKDYQAINFGARASGTLGSVTNNISGGMFFITFDTEGISSGYYFGSESSTVISGRVTNNISGGSFVPMNGLVSAGSAGMYMGTMSGELLGGIYNNITGGTFDMGAVGDKGGICLGSYTENVPCAKIVNVIGDKNNGTGPMFLSEEVYMAGANAAIGVDTAPTAMPDVSECSDTVVVSNTIYGGFFDKGAFCGPYSSDTATKFNFAKGSIETNVYGGMSKGTFYGAGSGDVYGKVTLNLHGGVIGNIYAAGNAATVYDGVELNIREGFREYHDVSKDNSWNFWGGAYGTNIPAPYTTGRDALKITVSAENSNALILKTPIQACCRSTYTIDGPISVSVSGGVFPEGFRISGKTVNAALAPDYVCVDTSTGTLLKFEDTDTTTGETSVTVIHKDDVQEPVIPDEYIATVKNGQITAYPNSVEDMVAAISPSGESVVTLYEDITREKAIVFPYSCTIDFNGHTITTSQTSGNGIEISAIGSNNATTTLKNGTLRHYTLGVKVNAGAIVVDNMKILSASGAPVGIYDTDGAYKSINRVTGSLLASKSYTCIHFNKSNADFTNTGITVTDSVLVSYKSKDGGVALFGTKGTGGTVTIGKDVKLYSYKAQPNGTTVLAGEELTLTANQKVTVDGTEHTGMNLWTSPTSQNVAVNAQTGEYYTDLATALTAAKATGGTVRLRAATSEDAVTVSKKVTLDLNGQALETEYFTCYGTVTDGDAGGDALIKATGIHIAGQDSFMPIYDSANGGYRLYDCQVKNLTPKTVNSNAMMFGLQLGFENENAYSVLGSTDVSKLELHALVNWTGNAFPVDYVFKASTLKNYAAQVAADLASKGSSGKAIALTVTGVENLQNVTMTPSLVSATSVSANGNQQNWTGNAG